MNGDLVKNYAIITGDIVGSRKVKADFWLPILQDTLTNCSAKFDIFRGDSFQLLVDLKDVLECYFYIKARIKTISTLDVRMSIGIGAITYNDAHIKNSYGEAFLNSGEAFDQLDKNLIAIRTPWKEWDEMAIQTLDLAVELANKWTSNMAETVAVVIRHKDANQHELAKILDRKYQSQVSTEINKSNWYKINRAIEYCTNQLLQR